jgi:VIT1/CCC1 family predicted Fe2+/Mn2+ transporter
LALAVKDFDAQNPVHGLLAAVNVMTFWLLAVRSIGLARLSGASFGKAAAWMFGIWAAFTALMVGFSFAMLAISRAMTGG